MEGNRRVAIVTGASSGIGQGIAVVLAEHGYDIGITYRNNRDGAEETADAVEALGRRCLIYQADLSTVDTPTAVVDNIRSDAGRIDVLVNNAGKDSRTSVLTATAEDYSFIFDTHFRGYMLCTGAAARHMIKDGIAGSIIFVTSSRAERAYAEDFIYGGIKAAVKRACESIALDLSPYGIRVNCVGPGATVTRGLPLSPPADAQEYSELGRSHREGLADIIPLKRLGLPRESGELVAFLVSDKARYITGVSVRVDGGLILPGMPEHGRSSGWQNLDWTEEHHRTIMESDSTAGE